MPWLKTLFWSYLGFLLCASATATNPADPDLWHRLTLGEFLWIHHAFPTGGQFSYLADYQSIADHEWGGAVLFYALWNWGGPAAIVLTKLVTLAITLALLIRAGMESRQPTVLLAAFYALVMLALLPSFQSTVRCMVFTHLIFALWLLWYQRERRGLPTPVVLYPATMILWANLHGGFVIGLLWLALVGVLQLLYGRPWRPWALRCGLATVATLVNPYGWQLWISTGRALVAPRQGFNEWGPISWGDFLSYPGYKLLLVAVVLALCLARVRKGWKSLDAESVILIGCFLALSFASARHTSLFALVAGALLPPMFPQARPFMTVRSPVRRMGVIAANSALILVPLYSGIIVFPGSGLTLEYPHIACPVGAVQYLQQQGVRGNLLVPFNYGSYAMWQLRGRMRVSMDGRYDLVYRPETYRRVDDFFMGRGSWQTLLTTPEPEAILVPRDAPVYPKLKGEPGWRQSWQDEWDAVFVRAST